MDAFTQRTWIPFYVISFGTLSVVIFQFMSGAMLLVSLTLVTSALGVIFTTIQTEVARSTEQKELMADLSEKVHAAANSLESGAK